MRLEITHPAFRTQRLAVETAGWFTGPKLLVNGSVAEKRKGRYTVASDSGTEYTWIGIPVLLVFMGGAIGGFVGALGAVASGRVFRGSYSTAAKYGLSALIALGALVAFVVLATLFQLLVGSP